MIWYSKETFRDNIPVVAQFAKNFEQMERTNGYTVRNLIAFRYKIKHSMLQHVVLTVCFLTGFVFRLWFVHLVPQPFIFDQIEYDRYAKVLLGENVTDKVTSYRTFGYPMILAFLYSLFGSDNRWSWVMFQALLDTVNALFLFFIGRMVFRKTSVAWIAFMLYLFNPITSAYVGVRLTETVTTFLVNSIILFMLCSNQKTRLIYFVLASVTLGFLPYVRPGFLYFSIFLMCALLYLIYRESGKTIARFFTMVCSIMLFTFPMLYNISRNLAYYRTPSLMTVVNNAVKDFYLSMFIANQDTGPYTPEWMMVYKEYFTGTTKDERDALAQKYLNLAKEEIEKNPWLFIISRFQRIPYIWDKHTLFLYSNPYSEQLHPYIYWGNKVLLASAVAGFVLWWKKEHSGKNKLMQRMAILTLFLAGYISFIHMFVMASGRFSIPAYPIVFLFAAYSWWNISQSTYRFSTISFHHNLPKFIPVLKSLLKLKNWLFPLVRQK